MTESKTSKTTQTSKSEPSKVTTLPTSKVPAKTRWVKNAFFHGGSTKNIRLDEIHNELNSNYAGQGDTTDRELAAEILNRAGLKEHSRYSEILEGLTEFFESVPDPAMKWVNQNYGYRYPKHISPE